MLVSVAIRCFVRDLGARDWMIRGSLDKPVPRHAAVHPTLKARAYCPSERRETGFASIFRSFDGGG